MSLMFIGFALFFGVHVLPSTPLSSALKRSLGENQYKALFSLLSLAGLIVIVFGYRQVPVELVFAAKPWARAAAVHTMPVVFILLAAAQSPSHIRQWLRHPMMTGVLIWSLLHYFANGERAAVWLFGSFILFSVFSIVSSSIRGQTIASTGKPVTWRHDAIAIVAGLIVYGVVLFAHGWLFNRPLLPVF